MSDRPRPLAFYVLAAFFVLFVAFLYGPTLTILVLSFQGPQGGLTFPMNGVSTHWFGKLWAGLGIVDIWGALWRSLRLGLVVMLLTVVIAFFAGLAFRKRFRGEGVLFTVSVASLIVPSIVVSLGIGLEFRLLDEAVKWAAAATGWGWLQDHGTLMGLYTSALGAHLTWTLPFGLLIMFAVFNRFDPAYEEAARDLGATGPRPCATWWCRSSHPPSSAWRCSASPCPSTNSPARARPSAVATPCRWNCRASPPR